MALTDIAALILSILFLVRGASRGFMNSLTGPFSIIVTTILSILYYQTTKDLITSLLIGLIGPLFLNLLLKFLLKTWAKATNTETKPDFLSRLWGSVLTLIWGWVFIIFTLILLTVLPPWGETLTAIRNDVTKSASYLITKNLEKTLFANSKQNVLSFGDKDHEVETLGSSDAKSLAEDPRFQKILQDPDIQKEIQAHDLVKLMGNPKMMDFVQQMMNDPATMQKVLNLYKTSGSLTNTKFGKDAVQ